MIMNLSEPGGTDREQRWELRMEWPLTATALVFLAAYAWEVLADLQGHDKDAAETVVWVTWAVFVLDYLARLWLTPRRGRWFVRHLPDLLIVTLPMLRPLRLLRLVNLLGVLNRTAGAALRGRVVLYIVGSTTILITVSSLAMLEAERHSPDAGIHSYGDALWWSITTISTVGYGDTHPTTGSGRLIAAGLMIAGVALLGTVTATLASWLVNQVTSHEDGTRAATAAQVRELRTVVDGLRADLAAIRAAMPAIGGGVPGDPPGSVHRA